MSQIQIQKRQPAPSETLVQRFPVIKGKKLETTKLCKICFAPSIPSVYDTNTCSPLVLKCTKCGCKSWATQ
ncbi:hypothetical protein [Nitrosarchaeum sp.]|uniref:hypothetical protein n=1 Tax=Nitrosarchaeum sp. TaxID=2026886 RepID=UPI00247CB945|nr:hypothetical protein [Nitrosarchaeum sp.]MCV0412878.1 hypothetical protein [Nitrosarchaeum sp.]